MWRARSEKYAHKKNPKVGLLQAAGESPLFSPNADTQSLSLREILSGIFFKKLDTLIINECCAIRTTANQKILNSTTNNYEDIAVPLSKYSVPPVLDKIPYARCENSLIIGVSGSYNNCSNIIQKINEHCRTVFSTDYIDLKIVDIYKEKAFFLGFDISYTAVHQPSVGWAGDLARQCVLGTKYAHNPKVRVPHKNKKNTHTAKVPKGVKDSNEEILYKKPTSSFCRPSYFFSKYRDPLLTVTVNIPGVIKKLRSEGFIKKNKPHPKYLWLPYTYSQIIHLYNSVFKNFINYYSFSSHTPVPIRASGGMPFQKKRVYLHNYSRLVSCLNYYLKQSCAKLLARKYSLSSRAKVYKKFGPSFFTLSAAGSKEDREANTPYPAFIDRAKASPLPIAHEGEDMGILKTRESLKPSNHLNLVGSTFSLNKSSTPLPLPDLRRFAAHASQRLKKDGSLSKNLLFESRITSGLVVGSGFKSANQKQKTQHLKIIKSSYSSMSNYQSKLHP